MLLVCFELLHCSLWSHLLSLSSFSPLYYIQYMYMYVLHFREIKKRKLYVLIRFKITEY